MTNGDWLRARMTDSFIANHYFCRLFTVCRQCPLIGYADCDSKKRRMKWLKQEYKHREVNGDDNH